MASFQSSAATGYGHHGSPQQSHPEDIEPLAVHVLLAHVDCAVVSEQSAYGRGGHSVLARAGFRDDAPLAHAPREQSLPQTVIDLVRAGMKKVFALDVNLCPAQLFGEATRVIERRRTPGISRQQVV